MKNRNAQHFILAVMIGIFLTACGGGGGGSAEQKGAFIFEDLAEDPISFSNNYSGSREHTSFNRRTAKFQSYTALSSLAVYLDFATTAIDAATPFFISYLPSKGNSSSVPIINDDGSFYCSTGRSRVTDSRSSTTGIGQVSFFYDNCQSGALLFDGSFTIHIRKFSEYGLITDSSIVFEDFLSYVSDQEYGLVDGEIDTWIDESTSLVKSKGSLYMVDSELNGAVLLEHISMNLSRYHSSSIFGAGRIYLEHHGYSDFSFSNDSAINFEGASDTEISVSLSTFPDEFQISLADGIEEDALSVRIPSSRYLEAATGVNVAPDVSTNIASVSVEKDHIINLSSELSKDPNFDFLKGGWRVVSAPDGCAGQLYNVTWFTADFVSDCSGRFLIEAAVEDGELTSKAQVNIYVYKDFGVLQNIGTNSPVSLGEETEVHYEILNPEQGPFEVNTISAPFPVSVDEINASVSFTPQLPMSQGLTEVKLPFSIQNDRHITRSIKVTINGNNAPYRYVSVAPSGGLNDPLQVMDYDNDGKKELIQSFRGVPVIYEVTNDNELIFEWAFPYAFEEEINTWSGGSKFVDYDQDGDFDLMTLSGSHLYFINGDSKEIEFVISGLCDNGDTHWQSNNHIFHGNFDDDAEEELVVYCNNKNTIQFVELSSMEISWESTVANGQYFFAGNVDDDAELEAVVVKRNDGRSIDVVDYQNRTVVSNSFDGWFNFVHLADTDGDGVKEIVTIVEHDFVEWGRVYDPKTAELKSRFNVNRYSGIEYAGWHNIDSDPQMEFFLLESFSPGCGGAEGSTNCLKIFELDNTGALVEQAHYPLAGHEHSVDFVAYSAESGSDLPALYLTIKNGSGYRAASSTKKYSGGETQEISFYQPAPSTTYSAAEGFSFFHDFENRALKWVDVIGNQVRVKNFDLDRTVFVSDELKQIPDLGFNPSRYELIRKSASQFNVLINRDTFGRGLAAVFDYENETIISQTDKVLYSYQISDVNSDGHMDVIFTESLGDTTLNYWDVYNDTVTEDFVVTGEHGIEGFKVDERTGDLFVVVDEFIDDLVIKRYSKDQSGVFQLVGEGRTSTPYKDIYFGDFDKDGRRDVYLPTHKYDASNWQFKIFDYQLKLVQETESAPLTYELAFIESDTFGDIFIGSHLSGISYRDPGHVLSIFSPMHNEAMWISPELDISGYEGDIYPFIDNGRLRLAVNHSGLYISK